MRARIAIIATTGALIVGGGIAVGTAWASTSNGSATSARSAAVCDTRQLEITVLDGEAGMNSIDYRVQVKNINTELACKMPQGLTLTLDGANGTLTTVRQLGAPKPMSLKPEATATTWLKTLSDATNLPSGRRCTAFGHLEARVVGDNSSHSTGDTKDTEIRSCGGITASALTVDK